MRFDVLTLFPEMFSGYLSAGMLSRAMKKGLVDIHLLNIRDFARGPHKTTDDRPYGGGEGMVMKAGPIFRALKALPRTGGRGGVVLLSPQGAVFDQAKAWELSAWDQVILVCGRYEGVDERIRPICIDFELSIGDYVLTGGEPAAIVVMDAVVRLIPGVLGGEKSTLEDSFQEGLLEYPQYTRPSVFQDLEVPAVLLSGNHEKVRRWRREQSIRRTLERRPDLLEKATLSEEDRRFLAGLVQKGKETSDKKPAP